MSWLFNDFVWSFHVCCDVHLTYGFQNPVHKWEGMRTKQWLICHAHSRIFCNGKAQHHLLLLKHAQTVSILHQVNISSFGLACLFVYLKANLVSVFKCCKMRGLNTEIRLFFWTEISFRLQPCVRYKQGFTNMPFLQRCLLL